MQWIHIIWVVRWTLKTDLFSTFSKQFGSVLAISLYDGRHRAVRDLESSKKVTLSEHEAGYLHSTCKQWIINPSNGLVKILGGFLLLNFLITKWHFMWFQRTFEFIFNIQIMRHEWISKNAQRVFDLWISQISKNILQISKKLRFIEIWSIHFTKLYNKIFQIC